MNFEFNSSISTLIVISPIIISIIIKLIIKNNKSKKKTIDTP